MNDHERAQFEREGRIAKVVIAVFALLVIVPAVVVFWVVYTVGLPIDGH